MLFPSLFSRSLLSALQSLCSIFARHNPVPQTKDNARPDVVRSRSSKVPNADRL